MKQYLRLHIATNDWGGEVGSLFLLDVEAVISVRSERSFSGKRATRIEHHGHDSRAGWSSVQETPEEIEAQMIALKASGAKEGR